MMKWFIESWSTEIQNHRTINADGFGGVQANKFCIDMNPEYYLAK